MFLFSCTIQLLLACSLSQPVYAVNNEYPGKLVDIGTHKLHIYCSGTGRPTVIIDSGLGGFSLEWWHIQKNLSVHVKVCSYDRAGYGWSETGPKPRTTRQIAEELRLLLINASVPGPYVLVGHSFGGFNVRYFASMNPELAAAMVLIDSSHPDQFFRFPEPRQQQVLSRPKGFKYKITNPVMPEHYPEEIKILGYWLMASYKARMTYRQEAENLEASADQVLGNNHLPDIPVTVISRGKRVWPPGSLGNELESIWDELQDDLLSLSSHGLHIRATQSGHLIHLDQPDLVTWVILNAVIDIRNSRETGLANNRSGNFPLYPAHQLANKHQPIMGSSTRHPLTRWNHEPETSYYISRLNTY